MTAQQFMEAALEAHRRGELAEAARLYGRVLQAAPGNVGAQHMLGVVYAQQGRKAEALNVLSVVARQAPHDPLVLSNFGNALWESSRFDEALEAFDRSVALAPFNPDAFNNRGNVLAALGRYPEALESYGRAIALRPAFALAHKNQGDVLQQTGRSVDAIVSYDRAIQIDPGFSDAFFGRGISLRAQARYQEALESYDRSLELAPAQPAALNNRGVCLQNLGRLTEAVEVFGEAISLSPEMPEPRLNLATVLLLQERFGEGLPLYEWRKKMPDPVENRHYPQPLWTGSEPLGGKTLLLYVEQGFGDAVMFYRFALDLRGRCRRLILAVHPRLLRLLGSNAAGIDLIGHEDVANDFDYHIPLPSVPLALGTRSDSIPCSDKYLSAEAVRVKEWASRIGLSGFRIGVAWEGNMSIPGAEGKSFRLDHLGPISQMKGVRLINLQKGKGAEQLQRLSPGMKVESYPFDEGADAFLDTAAIMQNCDLVITADTAPAHLAGALGIPCWVALKFVPEWRWFLERSDTPWYPHTRLFRQKQPGEWRSVFADMEAELSLMLGV